jgi:hypothetical protein
MNADETRDWSAIKPISSADLVIPYVEQAETRERAIGNLHVELLHA